jgi:hypothetical protein
MVSRPGCLALFADIPNGLAGDVTDVVASLYIAKAPVTSSLVSILQDLFAFDASEASHPLCLRGEASVPRILASSMLQRRGMLGICTSHPRILCASEVRHERHLYLASSRKLSLIFILNLLYILKNPLIMYNAIAR